MDIPNGSVKTSVKAKPAGAIHFSEHIQNPRSTPQAVIDNYAQILQSHKLEWAQLEIHERLMLLTEVRKEMMSVKNAWIQAELDAKGIQPETFPVAEEWTMLAQIFRAIRQIEISLKRIDASESVVNPKAIREGPEGRVVLRTFPQTLWDRVIFLNVTGDVWIQPGIKPEVALTGKIAKYSDPHYEGKVSLVLGGGNSSMLPVCDSFHKLFVDLQVVMLKLNPVNAHLGPLIEQGLQSLIRRGFLAVVYGGPEVGAYVCNHPVIEELHMTGSDKTYEAVVFGIGEEGNRRKRERKPINTKPFTAELGNVTPVIIVPGPWKSVDIDEYSKHIGTWLTANAGFACLTPRVIIQHKAWAQRERLSNSIREELAHYPNRKAYYPGAFNIHKDFVDAHPEAQLLGDAKPGQLPWTLIPDLDPSVKDDICFRREGFGGISGEVSLGGEDIEEFLSTAVEFANNSLWGSLCAILIVHPKSKKDPAIAAAVEHAIAELQYGTVAVNMLAFYSSYFMVCPWGAIPGHDTYDIQSGIGRNFNFAMLDGVEKVVVRAPFKRIDPLTIRAKRAHVFTEKLTAFEARPSWFRLIDLMLSAMTS
ncbi:MAG: aldehyde dehydrogenase [Anaerolineales bacterium]|nr:MAG: aldehyde dehydrogenase [Anaerolineales bacterium]